MKRVLLPATCHRLYCWNGPAGPVAFFTFVYAIAMACVVLGSFVESGVDAVGLPNRRGLLHTMGDVMFTWPYLTLTVECGSKK
jgi:hypothetical protein